MTLTLVHCNPSVLLASLKSPYHLWQNTRFHYKLSYGTHSTWCAQIRYFTYDLPKISRFNRGILGFLFCVSYLVELVISVIVQSPASVGRSVRPTSPSSSKLFWMDWAFLHFSGNLKVKRWWINATFCNAYVHIWCHESDRHSQLRHSPVIPDLFFRKVFFQFLEFWRSHSVGVGHESDRLVDYRVSTQSRLSAAFDREFHWVSEKSTLLNMQ